MMHDAKVARQHEQELAHLLVTELLAYQFAMPVRWSETQSVLFDDIKAERVIEFGPSNTLLNMAEKTLGQFHGQSDAANGIKRTLLSISKNYDEVHYETCPPPSPGSENRNLQGGPSSSAATQQDQSQIPAVPAANISALRPTPIRFDPSQPADEVPDVPVSALEAVRALLAHTLKQPESEISPEDTVRTLSRGRSTVQNEIVGDLLEEFGAPLLPDDVENVPVGDVAATAQHRGYDGKLRRCLRARVEKMVSAKMPASFQLSALRSHLRAKWGLASGRQDAVLLRALSQQPSARIGKNEDADAFFDGVARAYIDGAGLKRPAGSASSVSAGHVMLDSKLWDEIRGEQIALKKKIASLLIEGDEENSAASRTIRDSLIEMRAKLDNCETELGDDFCNGIKPIFKVEQARSYRSAWNWAHVDLLMLFYKCLARSSPTDPEELLSLQARLTPRWNDRLQIVRAYLLRSISARQDSAAEVARQFLNGLGAAKLEGEPDMPLACILCDRVASCSIAKGAVDLSRVACQIQLAQKAALEAGFISHQNSRGPANGHPSHLRNEYLTLNPHLPSVPSILRRQGASWVPHKALTAYMKRGPSLSPTLPGGILVGKTVLLTGAGPSSIGMALLPSLLRYGARVAVTTSRPMPQAGPLYQKIFAAHAAPGAELVVFPCNQCSRRDLEQLIAHVYDDPATTSGTHRSGGLGWDLDFVLPFAALSEKGREIDQLDGRSELAHRSMLTNVLRLLGLVKAAKAARGIRSRPAQVLLPLSPNVGTFGGDGLYAESKVGLFAVLNKWASESWRDYLSLCGVVIGWTRGTGLMADNDWLSTQVESKLSIATYSTEEMARHIVGLMTDRVVMACQSEVLLSDISGGMTGETGLAEFAAGLRRLNSQNEDIKRALAEEQALDMEAVRGKPIPASEPIPLPGASVNLELGFPALPDYDKELEALHQDLSGMIDLESVVVVVGFAEIGPWGNSRTRWEMELDGQLSIQGCIELAWMTGIIKYDNATGEWKDSASGTPVLETEVKVKYEKRLLEHTGLRFINPSHLDHPDRDKKQMLQELVLQHDLEPFTASHDTAMEFAREHKDKVEIRELPGNSDEYTVRLRKGAVLLVPKAKCYDRIVGGQIPTGWDPRAYGLTPDICEAVDRCTLFALVCAAEAFLSAGLLDVYELYGKGKEGVGGLHVSELANCVGSGMGGLQSLQKLYRQRYLDRPVQNDVLAETFVNTPAAWLNMLLLGSAGPIRTPVGACATALESLNQGYDLIAGGAAKVCLVGGFDDMSQDTSDEFGLMRATNNSAADLEERGRAPHEMSRPCASSRCGFVESEGCGMQVLASAKVAVELGLPIRAVIAHVQTASDGVGRSVPAPGKGIMTTVSEGSSAASGGASPLLDIAFRRRFLENTLSSIRGRKTNSSSASFPPLIDSDKDKDENDDDAVQLSLVREEREARRRFGNAFWTHDPRISPLRGALAVWGLTADDITFVSMHGTSTELNEKNEVEVLHRQLRQLGRSPGNAALVVCQKYLTGHPKGAAAAWMLNGSCQALDAGTVPGNRNADDVDAAFKSWDHLVFPDRPVPVGKAEAFTITSFGFGQKGAQALGVHPRRLFATLNHARYEEYCCRRRVRYYRAQQHFQNAFYGGHMVTPKDEPPYPRDRQVEVLIDASARWG